MHDARIHVATSPLSDDQRLATSDRSPITGHANPPAERWKLLRQEGLKFDEASLMEAGPEDRAAESTQLCR
jgi:hypothetical protein